MERGCALPLVSEGGCHRLMSLEEVAHLVCSWRVRPLSANNSEISRLLCRFYADFHKLSDLLGDILRGRRCDPARPHQAPCLDVSQGHICSIRCIDLFAADRKPHA